MDEASQVQVSTPAQEMDEDGEHAADAWLQTYAVGGDTTTEDLANAISQSKLDAILESCKKTQCIEVVSIDEDI